MLFGILDQGTDCTAQHDPTEVGSLKDVEGLFVNLSALIWIKD